MSKLNCIQTCFGLHGGAVGSTVALQQECPLFDSRPWENIPRPGCLGSLHARVLTGYSGFLPQSKDMSVRLIGLRCVNEYGCLCVALQWTGDLSRVYPASRP
ncbi:hypothetical protein AMECASPLE_035983 [Ameca splendens]|uniref:Uncharacterized protein n=1 Tax=Ameca splendens TaxID=208324 RepID=A0ABV0Y7E0_9TELE